MTLSPLRGPVSFLLGLPVGFILAALGFAVTGRAIEAPALAPYALGIAAICGVAAVARKNRQ